MNNGKAIKESLIKMSGLDNSIVKLKDEYKHKINKEQNKLEIEPIAIEKLKLDFIDMRARRLILNGNFIKGFLSQYIYQHFVIDQKMGYLVSTIFFLLVLQSVRSKFLNFLS